MSGICVDCGSPNSGQKGSPRCMSCGQRRAAIARQLPIEERKRRKKELYNGYKHQLRHRAKIRTHKAILAMRGLRQPPLSASSQNISLIKLPPNPPHRQLLPAERQRRYALRQRLKNARKNARRQKAGGRVKVADIDWLMSAQGGRCFYCCKKLRKWHIDHFTPLSRGGTNQRDNLRLACPGCNLAKSDKPPEQFLGVLLI